jgi:DNA-binding transcriptional MocR family regulator
VRLGEWSAGPGRLQHKLGAALREVLARSDLRPGDRLPPERKLADALLVSRTTVVAVYDLLAAEGWLERRRGSGTTLTARHRAAGVPSTGHVAGGTGSLLFDRLLDERDGTISLARATSPASNEVLQAAQRVLTGDGKDLLRQSGYQPRGLTVLRGRLAERLTRSELPTDERQLLITTGAHQALALIAASYLRRGDRVIVESPSFAGCLDVLRAAEVRLVPVPIDEQGVRVDAIKDALRDERAALIYVMPTYHNPAGVTLSEHRRRSLAEVASAAGVPILEDNALAGASLGGEPPPPIAAWADDRTRAPVLSVGSLSKSIWAGLRIGWVRAPAAIIDRLARHKALADLGSPVISQLVAAELLPELDALIEARSAELRGGLARLEDLLRRRLPTWQWRTPDGGPSLWVRVPAGDTTTLSQLALRHGIELVPGSTMSADGGHREWLRIPYSFTPAELDLVVDRLARTWEAYTALFGTSTPEDPVVV